MSFIVTTNEDSRTNIHSLQTSNGSCECFRNACNSLQHDCDDQTHTLHSTKRDKKGTFYYQGNQSVKQILETLQRHHQINSLKIAQEFAAMSATIACTASKGFPITRKRANSQIFVAIHAIAPTNITGSTRNLDNGRSMSLSESSTSCDPLPYMLLISQYA